MGSAQICVSNLMIDRVVALGYNDDRWEKRTAKMLREAQIAHLQRSTAFMSHDEALSYYRLNDSQEEDS
ncbi:hypothetical protein ACVR0S_09505 [Streptococcus dentapri]|uniref:Uncharacterized protein n=1 Tax=Streptococcus dentapri TaxID=573564 RepID=A0ABV8D314_9STRE